ncbi:hypothetical protein [Parafrigoribacterium soli]|uniref:hypothetical protein n=1 Tax=Parafrigoribacterium soli TaxID=3144663 RepID=UPI0032ECC4B5
MRSSVPIPGNPWPHDMTITIEESSQPLLELLWVREAWGLHPVGDDLPPLLADQYVSAQPEVGIVEEFARWQYVWSDLWEACVKHASLIPDPSAFERLRETADGSVERAQGLKRMYGRSWRDTFGDAALTDRYRAWTLANFEAHARLRPKDYEEAPERVSLAALIPAWEAGLSKIVVIPCRGSHTRIIGEHSLLVTAETRNDPQRYSEALAQFQ